VDIEALRTKAASANTDETVNERIQLLTQVRTRFEGRPGNLLRRLSVSSVSDSVLSAARAFLTFAQYNEDRAQQHAQNEQNEQHRRRSLQMWEKVLQPLQRALLEAEFLADIQPMLQASLPAQGLISERTRLVHRELSGLVDQVKNFGSASHFGVVERRAIAPLTEAEERQVLQQLEQRLPAEPELRRLMGEMFADLAGADGAGSQAFLVFVAKRAAIMQGRATAETMAANPTESFFCGTTFADLGRAMLNACDVLLCFAADEFLIARGLLTALPNASSKRGGGVQHGSLILCWAEHLQRHVSKLQAKLTVAAPSSEVVANDLTHLVGFRRDILCELRNCFDGNLLNINHLRAPWLDQPTASSSTSVQ
jgi:hypothetical protein